MGKLSAGLARRNTKPQAVKSPLAKLDADKDRAALVSNWATGAPSINLILNRFLILS
jgi:hypothetical protein